jgi:hypothetical protein
MGRPSDPTIAAYVEGNQPLCGSPFLLPAQYRSQNQPPPTTTKLGDLWASADNGPSPYHRVQSRHRVFKPPFKDMGAVVLGGSPVHRVELTQAEYGIHILEWLLVWKTAPVARIAGGGKRGRWIGNGGEMVMSAVLVDAPRTKINPPDTRISPELQPRSVERLTRMRCPLRTRSLLGAFSSGVQSQRTYTSSFSSVRPRRGVATASFQGVEALPIPVEDTSAYCEPQHRTSS